MKKILFVLILCNFLFAKGYTVMFGDSITKGANWSSLVKDESIKNYGINGDTVYNMQKRVNSLPKETNKVFIMGGINDIVKGTSVKSIFVFYKELVRKLQEKDIKIYIQSTLLTGSKIDSSINKKIKQLNILLKDFSRKNNIKFFDLNRYLSKKNYLKRKYTYDEVHLNHMGYYVWLNVIKSYLKN